MLLRTHADATSCTDRAYSPTRSYAVPSTDLAYSGTDLAYAATPPRNQTQETTIQSVLKLWFLVLISGCWPTRSYAVSGTARRCAVLSATQCPILT
eukprot:2586526-Rhodomonas_salina.1